jgi:cytoskeleton protein RodZ
MNDPVPNPELAQGQTVEAQPSAPSGDFGAVLRAAREAAGITVPTLASRLRLHVRQIEALERSDLAALPTLIYVRGFLRSCARELKIDVVPLLADLDRRAGVVPGAPLTPSGSSFHLARLGDGSRPIIALAIVALIVAGVIGTLWPRRASVPPKPAIAETPVPAPAPPAADAAAASATTGAMPDPAPAVGTAARPAVPAAVGTLVPAAPAPPSATSATNRPLVKAAPPPPTDAHVAAAPKVAIAPAGPAGAKPVAAPTAAPASAPVPAPAPVLATTAVAAAGDATLVLRVHASSWVEVVQANGTSVFSQICPAGSVQTVHAEPPLRIVVGNAAAVEAQYRGNAVDLNRYANANGVARFTLQ